MAALANRPPKPLGRGSSDQRPYRLQTLWSSTIGKKYVVAVTGVVMAVWVIAHMLGNLKAIEGPGHGHAALDSYGEFLRRAGSPVLPHNMLLWIERIVLVSVIMLHLTAVTQLWLLNRRAKPPAHQAARRRSTLSARSMRVSGVVVLGFLVFHILHFTLRVVHPAKLTQGAIYANAYGSFHEWWVVVFYVGSVALLGLHLNHGLWSGAQTAGSDNPDRNWFWRRLASLVSWATVVGFALVPLLFAFDALPKPVHP